MRKEVAALVALLVASNAAWAWVVWGKSRADTNGTPDRSPEARVLEERVRVLEAELAAAGSARREARPQLEPARVPPKHAGPSAEEVQEKQAAARAAAVRVQENQRDLARRQKTWVADALQVADAAKREATLREVAAAIRSEDAELAAISLRTVVELRSLKQELAQFRPLVLASLGNADAKVRSAAAYALFHIPRENGDLERVLAMLESATTDAPALLHVALMLNNRRAEGRLGDEFVRRLAGGDDGEVEKLALQLLGQWVSAEVEDAVLAGMDRSKKVDKGMWARVLGSMRPARERRVRVILAWMAKPEDAKVLDQIHSILLREVDEPAKPVAAALALETLPTGVDNLTRSNLLRIVLANGTAEHAPALRAFAANSLVTDELRKEAERTAASLEQRGR